MNIAELENFMFLFLKAAPHKRIKYLHSYNNVYTRSVEKIIQHFEWYRNKAS